MPLLVVYIIYVFLAKFLASVKPISTIKAAFPSFDVLFSLAVVNVVVVVVVVVVVIVVVVVSVLLL